MLSQFITLNAQYISAVPGVAQDSTPLESLVHFGPDGVTALAFYIISITMLYVTGKRQDMSWHWFFILFGILFFSCGTMHLLSVLAAYLPVHQAAGILKSITAMLAVAAAAYVVYSLPVALQMPSLKRATEEIQTLNTQLARQHKAQKEQIEGRHNAENKVATANALLKSLLHSIPDLIFYKDSGGVYLGCNDAFANYVGISEKDLVGRTDLDLFPQQTATNYQESDRFVLTTGKHDNSEHTGKYPDGKKVLFHTLKTPIYSAQGDVLGLIGISRDLTERKKTEHAKILMEKQLQQSQKMEAIGNLSGGIAHDFNNILSAIIGYSELAIEDINHPDKTRPSLKAVLKAAERAKELVKQILTFSRREQASKHPVLLQDITREVLKLVRSTIPTTIEIKPCIDQETGPVMADDTQLHQVIMNLCTNAWQAMRDTGGYLAVSINKVNIQAEDLNNKFRLNPGSYVILEIRDTGHGITKDHLERIFEPYFTTKKQSEGTGLGLSVVHGIIENHNGMITVYSEPEHGSTFKVYLPEITQAGQDDTVLSELPGGTEKVMVVDDEEAVMDVVSRILQSLGYRVTGFNNSLGALDTFQQDPMAYDLVITDMTMPNMAGDSLARNLMKIRSGLPIILCTGFSDSIDKDRAAELGIREFILKPVLKRDLAVKVRSALDQSVTGAGNA